MAEREDGLKEARSLAKKVSESHEWLDVDDLDDDEDFAELVALLADPERISDDGLAAATRDGSKFLRAGATQAIANGRRPSADWAERAKKRFVKAEWGERQLLLRALTHANAPVIMTVLDAAEADWSGSPLADAVAEFLAARVGAGERVTSADLARLDVRLQSLVGELVEAAGPTTQEALGRPVEEWRRESINVSFFREIGRVLDPAGHPEPTLVGTRAIAVDAVTAALSSRRPRSVLFVGEQGVGKTTLILEALRRVREKWFAFQATAAEIQAGQMYIGMMEGRVQEIVREMSDRPIAWVFPAFEEALWSGQHTQSPRGLLDALLPHVESGEITIVAEIDPLAYELLLQHRPRVGRLFDVIRLAPMPNEDALAVARGWAESHGVDVDDETLAEALDLATHYLAATVAPGNLLRLLELVRDRVARGLADRIAPASVIAALSDATGLPLHVLDPRTPLSLDDVKAFFEERVLGQPEAVNCLVERIALVKAGLTDPSRPLGVFLFVGPTGTGKTEIAKAFSEFLFGSADRLVRLDMSEFQTPESLERLLGDTASGMEAAPLIASVRKEPFSVLLLDEFEKAHTNVWDVFLQVFDDGRLTDRNGRTVDLRHCVIILTSNLGSAIPRGPGVGFAGRGGVFEPETVLKSVERSFRPEFLNRLDRVVVFRPLGRDVMRGLLEKELSDVLRRRGLRMQPWAVEWDEAAVDFLIEAGFSAELGARPLKRAIEQHLLTRIATTIVERNFPEGDQFLFITARDGEGIDVAFVDPDAEEPGPSLPSAAGDPSVTRLALDAHGSAEEAAYLRGELESLSARVRTWQEHKERALEQMRDHRFWASEDRHAVLALVEYLDRLGAATTTAQRLGARLGSERETHSRELVRLLALRLHVLGAALDGLTAGDARDAEVVVRPRQADDAEACAAFAGELVEMYVKWAKARGMRVRARDEDGVTVLEISGLGAYTLLTPEHGLHVLEEPQGESSFGRLAVLVAVSAADPGAVAAPSGEPTIVRRYRREPSPLVRDASGMRTGRIDRVLAGDFDLLADAG